MPATECALCKRRLDTSQGAQYMHMSCTHHLHAACAAQLITAGRFRCVVCQPHAPAREFARVVDTGGDAAYAERIAAVLRAERADEVRLISALLDKGVRACAKNPLCLGGTCCFHFNLNNDSLSDDAMLASRTFDYGVDPVPVERLAQRLRINVLARRMPLAQAVECGVTVAILAFAGLRLSELLPLYLLEDLVSHLQLDWTTLKLLDFSPLMLADVGNLPIIVLYDLLALRAAQLFEFDVPREALAATLGESGTALLRLNLDVWPARRLEAAVAE